jgi:hypothetical protein
VGLVSGCPVGLSFIAWHGGDEALLDLAVKLARHVGAASAPGSGIAAGMSTAIDLRFGVDR